MGELRFEKDLLAEVTHRLDLREPNCRAVESVALRVTDHFDGQGKPAPFECVVDSATGVGKTYVMAALIEYLAGTATPARATSCSSHPAAQSAGSPSTTSPLAIRSR